MAFPLLLAAGATAALLFLGKKKPTGPASPSSPGAVPSPINPATGQVTPIAERMAVALASGNSAAIRFEAGRLRQEGYPSQAGELEREAGKLEAQAAAAQQAAGAAAAHAAAPPAAAPVVAPLPPGAVTSPGFVPPPAQAAPPPVVIQTPMGPISVPVPVLPPQPPVVVQTPAGPVSLPPVAVPPPPVVVQTPSGPISVQLPTVQQVAALLPLPELAPNEILSRTNPGQTTSPKTLLWQNKLVSLTLLKPADAIGKFGPTTEAATKQFQLLANAWLKTHPMPYQGKQVSSITVDGKVGPQTLTAATQAHPPTGTGPTAAYFGALQAPAYPQPASPLPGIVPPMAPKDIDPQMGLAARVAANLFSTATGQEDRSLVQLFQAQRGMKASGYYGPETAWGLAAFGIVPPKPRYWVKSGTTKAKRNYKKALLELAAKDPQRAEEWRAAANV